MTNRSHLFAMTLLVNGMLVINAYGTTVFDNWNDDTCSLTDTTVVTLPTQSVINRITTWYNWRAGESSVNYRLTLSNILIYKGTFIKGQCDSNHKDWCQGIDDDRHLLLSPDTYKVKVDVARVCKNVGSGQNGFLSITNNEGGENPPTMPSETQTSEQTPTKQGEYDIRLNDTGSKKETATIALPVGGDKAAATFTLPKTAYAPNEAITLSFTAPATFTKKTWIGMGPANIEHGSTERNDQHDMAYRYVKGRSSGIMSFTAPNKQGLYDFRMNDTSNDLELSSIAFEVKVDKAAANLSLPQAVYAPNEKITLSFIASPAYAKKTWIGLGPANIEHGSTEQNDQHDMAYRYVESRSNGTMVFNAPNKQGRYDFRMNDITNGVELTAVAFDVRVDKSKAQLSLAKSIYKPGETITLSFKAASTYTKKTWVGLGPANIKHGSTAQNDQHDLSYQYINNQTSGVMTFLAPQKVGQYDFRMNETTNDLELVALAFSVSDNPNGGGQAVTAGGGIIE
ncbi:MAG: hypothetical protein HRT35_14820 [Algicola sp.]|nr:hypothetical protein [Algicola sp.]